MRLAIWELLFFMVLLKLPVLYAIGVVVWAVRGGNPPYEPAPALDREAQPVDRPPARRFRQGPPRPGPHGSPRRRSRGRAAAAHGRLAR